MDEKDFDLVVLGDVVETCIKFQSSILTRCDCICVMVA